MYKYRAFKGRRKYRNVERIAEILNIYKLYNHFITEKKYRNIERNTELYNNDLSSAENVYRNNPNQ